MLLVPSDPLNPRRVDPHFAGQAAAARDRALAACDVVLRTSPAAYRAAHELPGWACRS